MKTLFFPISLIIISSLYSSIHACEESYDFSKSVICNSKMSLDQKITIMNKIISLMRNRTLESCNQLEEYITNLSKIKKDPSTHLEDQAWLLSVINTISKKLYILKTAIKNTPGYGLSQSTAIATESASKKLNIANTSGTEIDISDIKDAKENIEAELLKRRSKLNSDMQEQKRNLIEIKNMQELEIELANKSQDLKLKVLKYTALLSKIHGERFEKDNILKNLELEQNAIDQSIESQKNNILALSELNKQYADFISISGSKDSISTSNCTIL